jgi:hypothetical protein
MKLAFKIVFFLFFAFCLCIFLLYFFNHYSNRDIVNKAKEDISKNRENYAKLYAYLKEATNDSVELAGINDTGRDSLFFSTESKNKSKESKRKPEYFIRNISNFLMASYNRKYMWIDFGYANYHLYRSALIYPDNKDSVIKTYVSRGYIFYNSCDSIMNRKAVIDIDNGWLLTLHK